MTFDLQEFPLEHYAEEADYLEMTEEERMNSGGNGPASDDRIKEEGKGPATKS